MGRAQCRAAPGYWFKSGAEPANKIRLNEGGWDQSPDWISDRSMHPAAPGLIEGPTSFSTFVDFIGCEVEWRRNPDGLELRMRRVPPSRLSE